MEKIPSWYCGLGLFSGPNQLRRPKLVCRYMGSFFLPIQERKKQRRSAADPVYEIFKCLTCTLKKELYKTMFLNEHKRTCRKLLAARQQFNQERDAQRRKEAAGPRRGPATIKIWKGVFAMRETNRYDQALMGHFCIRISCFAFCFCCTVLSE